MSLLFVIVIVIVVIVSLVIVVIVIFVLVIVVVIVIISRIALLGRFFFRWPEQLVDDSLGLWLCVICSSQGQS